MKRVPSAQIRRRFGKADFPSLPQMKMFAIAITFWRIRRAGIAGSNRPKASAPRSTTGRRGLDARQILRHVLQNVVRRGQCRQDIDESKHLGFEHRIPHRPFHQTPVEIFASEKACSSAVVVYEVKNLPAQLLNFQLNRP